MSAIASIRIPERPRETSYIAQSGQRWRAHLTSVFIPTQEAAVTTFRTTWTVAVRASARAPAESYADRKD
jgi:hypothetical protein